MGKLLVELLILDRISSQNVIKAKIDALFGCFPDIDIVKIEFPRSWESEPLWQ